MTTLSYETCKLGDLQFEVVPPTPAEVELHNRSNKRGRRRIPKPRVRICINGQLHDPSKRFWKSLSQRYGFSEKVFRYISHEEMFKKVARKVKDDEIRVAIEPPKRGIFGTLQGTSNPNKPLVPHDEVVEVLKKFGGELITYDNGVVTSRHRPMVDVGDMQINGDSFCRGFQMSIPVDGYGSPASHLLLLRMVCSNGMIGEHEAFRSTVMLGNKSIDARPSLERFIESFNNDEGYSALSQRFASAGKSWASMNEARSLYQVLSANAGGLDLTKRIGGDGASADGSSPVLLDSSWQPIGDEREVERREESFIHVMRSFNRVVGDLSGWYGHASFEEMSKRRAQVLPVGCKVYELVNFATELATHYSDPKTSKALNVWVGGVLAKEFDLENSCDKFGDFQDFFLNENT